MFCNAPVDCQEALPSISIATSGLSTSLSVSSSFWSFVSLACPQTFSLQALLFASA
jgi:hypothetical protein